MLPDFLKFVYVVCTISLGILPGLFGYFGCRFTALGVRLIPALLLTASGAWALLHSAHQLGQFSLACVVYSLFCVGALLQRAKRERKRFWSYAHLDWMAPLSVPTLYFLASFLSR